MPKPGNIQNINDPIRNGYGYRPYTSPVAKADDPAKMLDLNGLSFSVEDFQKLASGKYNAGHIILDKKGKLDIANNHRILTGLNRVRTNAADALAVRIAFADALEAAGVSEERMEAVRERLGLGADSSFKAGVSLTPLTRQEVREIIDANIGEINVRRADGDKLLTEAQLHAGLDEQTKAERAAIRQSVTEEANRTVGLDFNGDMAYVIDFVQNRSCAKMSDGDLDDMITTYLLASCGAGDPTLLKASEPD